MSTQKIIILSVFYSCLSGCFGGGSPVPQDTYYRLSAPAIDHKIPSDTGLGVIAVSTLKSDALYRERAILYSDSDNELSLKRYHYHHWAAIPNNLIQEHLIEYLRETGITKQVVRYGQLNKIEAHITGYIKRFERIVNRSGNRVVVELELQVELIQGEKRRIFYRNYKTDKKPSSDSMQSAVEAFGAGLQEIHQHFVHDMKTQKII